MILRLGNLLVPDICLGMLLGKGYLFCPFTSKNRLFKGLTSELISW